MLHIVHIWYLEQLFSISPVIYCNTNIVYPGFFPGLGNLDCTLGHYLQGHFLLWNGQISAI